MTGLLLLLAIGLSKNAAIIELLFPSCTPLVKMPPALDTMMRRQAAADAG